VSEALTDEKHDLISKYVEMVWGLFKEFSGEKREGICAKCEARDDCLSDEYTWKHRHVRDFLRACALGTHGKFFPGSMEWRHYACCITALMVILRRLAKKHPYIARSEDFSSFLEVVREDLREMEALRR